MACHQVASCTAGCTCLYNKASTKLPTRHPAAAYNTRNQLLRPEAPTKLTTHHQVPTRTTGRRCLHHGLSTKLPTRNQAARCDRESQHQTSPATRHQVAPPRAPQEADCFRTKLPQNSQIAIRSPHVLQEMGCLQRGVNKTPELPASRPV